jgi:hypothetical protein
MHVHFIALNRGKNAGEVYRLYAGFVADAFSAISR